MYISERLTYICVDLRMCAWKVIEWEMNDIKCFLKCGNENTTTMLAKYINLLYHFFFIRKEWIDNNINKHVWTTIVTLDKRKNKIKYQYYSSWELFNPKHGSFPDLFFSSFCYGMCYPIIKWRSRSRVDYLFTEENCDTTWWRVYNKYV